MQKISILAMALFLTFASCKSDSNAKESSKESYYDSLSKKLDERLEKRLKERTEEAINRANGSESIVQPSVNNWDEVISEYESFIDDYIKTMKKVKAGDYSVMSEYQSLMQKAESAGKKLQQNEGQLTKEQMKRYINLQTKLSNAAVEMM